MRRLGTHHAVPSRGGERQTLMVRWLGMLAGRHFGPLRRAGMWASFVVVATGTLLVWDYLILRYPGIGDDRSIDVQPAPEWLVWLGLGLVAMGIAGYVVAALTASHEEASSPPVPVSFARWRATLAAVLSVGAAAWISYVAAPHSSLRGRMIGLSVLMVVVGAVAGAVVDSHRGDP